MIYLDSAASTFPRDDVLERFASSNRKFFANPASSHAIGREGGRKLEQIRKRVLDLFRLKNHSCIFLSGATEANNLAIKGVAFGYENRGKKLLYSAVEHPSVIEPMRFLANRFGFETIALPVDEWGRVNPKTLEEAMDKDVILVSIMGVNNETGAVNDLAALASIVHRFPKAFFHSDLTQAVGKMDVPYGDLDLFSFSAHKIHGLKESGALIYKSTMKLVPTAHGGGQESGMRSGTVSLALNEALALALERAMESRKDEEKNARILWNRLYDGIKDEPVRINSYPEGSPYVFDFSLLKHRASVIVEALSQKGIYVSSASACSSKTDRASDVLLAMGLPFDLAANGVRVSFSGANTVEEIDTFLATLHELLQEVHVR